MRNPRRVAITGLGVVSPVGIGKDAFWKSLVAGKSGVDYITAFDPTPYPCKVAAEIKDFVPTEFISARKASQMGRFSQLGVAATRLAIDDSKTSVTSSLAPEIHIYYGTSVNGGGDIA